MLKILFPFIIAISMLSCSKQSTSSSNSSDTYVSYKIDSNEESLIKNSFSTSFPISTVSCTDFNTPGYLTGYSFMASYSTQTSPTASSKDFILTIGGVDSLSIDSTYNLANVPNHRISLAITDSLFLYAADNDTPGSSINVSITSYNNGIINGMFNAYCKKTDINGNEFGYKAINGQFQNVKVNY